MASCVVGQGWGGQSGQPETGYRTFEEAKANITDYIIGYYNRSGLTKITVVYHLRRPRRNTGMLKVLWPLLLDHYRCTLCEMLGIANPYSNPGTKFNNRANCRLILH